MRLKRYIKYFLPWERLRSIALRAGKMAGRLLPRRNPSGLFFFFPFYQIGGAEKVHAQIVACVADRRPWVFFTNKSKDEKFRFLFESSARLFDISRLPLGSLRYYACVGALAAFINRHSRGVVFGSNNVFFYHLLPHLRRDIRRIDLLHAFGGDIEHVSLPFVSELDARVILSGQALSDLKAQYSREGLASELLDRVAFIDNQVAVPDNYPAKRNRGGRLQLLYVGRGAAEKRIHLVGRTAALCRCLGLAADFILVGDNREAIAEEHRSACTFKGEIADPSELNKLYAEADVLLLTSSREGFPLVIMEAMAYGTVPLSTDVGGISRHVENGTNGLLIENGEEERIVEGMVEAISRLDRNRTLLEEMSRHAYLYARQHFAPQRFCAAYRRLLLEEKT
ncbi:MAG TPA: glycosyltransferase family 4 protein [Pyrinomonadaceae bacterium]|jgi:glycosyltransferase involved in cell wall biosynthesis